MSKKIPKEFVINAVRNEPGLWDQRDKSYHNRDVKPELWQSIGDEFSVEGEEVRKIWVNLRDTFRRKFRNLHATKSGQGSSTQARWPYFNSMMFLKDVLEPQESSGNLPQDIMNEESAGYPITTEEANSDDAESDTFMNSTTQKKRSRDHDAQALEIKKRKIALFEQHLLQKKNRCEEDEDHLFFMSLLPTVRQLDQVEKMRLRTKILVDVTDALEAHNFSNDVRTSKGSSSPSFPNSSSSSTSFVPPSAPDSIQGVHF